MTNSPSSLFLYIVELPPWPLQNKALGPLIVKWFYPRVRAWFFLKATWPWLCEMTGLGSWVPHSTCFQSRARTCARCSGQKKWQILTGAPFLPQCSQDAPTKARGCKNEPTFLRVPSRLFWWRSWTWNDRRRARWCDGLGLSAIHFH